MAEPLTGITVLDVTSNISGPSLTMILADLGAEVIKIERPDIGDDSRGMGPMWDGHGAYYLNINRNKRSIVVDLKKEEGKDIVFQLAKTADVFVENFRHGKIDELGLGYDKLKEFNESIVYCSLSAFGEEGDKRYKPGYDAILQAETGIMGINGPEDGAPARAAVSILDQGSAMWGALGIVSALLQRMQTGKGQKVTTSLYETGVFWTGYHMLSYMATGVEPKKMGAGHAAFSPYGAYETLDETIMIGISNDSLFARLCGVLEKEEWSNDPRFNTNINRVENRKELDASIIEVLRQDLAVNWINKLDEAGVPSSIVKKVSSVISDPQTISTDMLVDVEHSQVKDLKLTRLPFQLSESTLDIKKAPPVLGEDTEAILTELGLDKEKIEVYLDKGIIQSSGINSKTVKEE